MTVPPDDPAGDPGTDPAARLRHIPALDGVRALAVVAVLLYHAGIGWAGGGFLGVDLFFVLSGYLITSLLVGEATATRTISLRRFWGRRARRLLPALFIVLAGVALYAAFLAPLDTRADVRRAALATLAYVANWSQIAGGQGYFAQLAAPTPLLHTWSLAIEEQFYVVWPLVVLGVLHFNRRVTPDSRPLDNRQPARRSLLVVASVGAVASAVAMAVLYRGGAGIDRVYYGTDTRAQDLLIGAALAVLPAAGVRIVGRLGGVGLIGLVAAFGLASGSSPWLYRGGFAALALAAAGLIAHLAEAPGSVVTRAFSLAPLRYAGRISYGLYLYHWPLYLVLDHHRTGLSGSALLGVRLAATAATSVLSFHLVEDPIRRKALSRRRAWVGLPTAATLVATALVLGTVAPAGAASGTRLGAGSVAKSSPASGGSSVARGSPGPGSAPVDAGSPHDLRPGTDPDVPSATGSGGAPRVLVVGDSSSAAMVLGFSPPRAYGVDLAADPVIGCGLVTAGLVSNRGIVANEDGGLRDGQWVRCDTWPERWAADVATFHPDVAVLMEGAWEVRDRYLDGRWHHLGQPDMDAAELLHLELAARVLGSNGARVVLLSSPYFSQPEQADGSAQPDDDPARVDRFNSLLSTAASRTGASVVDLGSWLSPGGHFAVSVGGTQVRDSDGIHLTSDGARLIEPRLMAALLELGPQGRR